MSTNEDAERVWEEFHYYFNISTAIVLSVVGLVGNAIVLYILTRPKFRKIAMFRYFIVLTVSETVQLLTIWPYNLADTFLIDTNSIVCKSVNYISYMLCQYIAWVIVISLVDRFINVKCPTRFQFRNDHKFQFIILSILFLILLILDIPFLLYYEASVDTSSNTSSCDTTDALTGIIIDFSDLMISTLIPFIIMVVISSLVGYQLITNKLRLNKKCLRKELSLIKVMFAIDIFFLLCFLPYCIQIIIYDSFSLLGYSIPFFMSLLYDIGNVLIFLYCSCNLFMYFFTNKLFRRYFLQMICMGNKLPNYSANDTTMNTAN